MDTTTNKTALSERSGSTASTGSASSPRRSSGTLFESLHAQKRGTDPASMARRQSLSDQRPQAGFFGQMWNNYVRGTAGTK